MRNPTTTPCAVLNSGGKKKKKKKERLIPKIVANFVIGAYQSPVVLSLRTKVFVNMMIIHI